MARETLPMVRKMNHLILMIKYSTFNTHKSTFIIHLIYLLGVSSGRARVDSVHVWREE